MLVYGIRCAPIDLAGLPEGATADYYMDYGLLVFSEYTRPTCIKSHGHLTPRFWNEVQRTIGSPEKPHEVDLEEPYITEDEDAVIKVLNEAYPGTGPAWYYVPHAIWTPPEEIPSIQVSDLPSAAD